jgi:riboflavin biosynthesis pyrimidine reductase
VLVIGAQVARQCVQEQLIDEIVVHIAPGLLGDGVRFFDCSDAREIVRLEVTDVA